MRFNEYPSKAWEEILPDVQSEERDLVSKLVVYESADRLSADEVCYTEFTRILSILIYKILGVAAPLFQRNMRTARRTTGNRMPRITNITVDSLRGLCVHES